MAGLTWYEQILRNRTTDAELARAIALAKETVAEKTGKPIEEDSAIRYVTPLVELARVVGRMEASGYGQPNCRSLMSQAAESAEELVTKGPSTRYWLDFYTTQAEPFCTGQ